MTITGYSERSWYASGHFAYYEWDGIHAVIGRPTARTRVQTYCTRQWSVALLGRESWL